MMAEVEEPKKNSKWRDIIIVSATAGAVLIVNAVTTFALDTGKAGIDAQAILQIQGVVDASLLTPDGRSIGAVLQDVQLELAGVKGELKGINDTLDIIVP